QFFCHSIAPLLFFLNQRQELQQRHSMLTPMIQPCTPLCSQYPSSYNDQCCDSYNFLQTHNLPGSSFLSSYLHQTSRHVYPTQSFVPCIFHSALDRRELLWLATPHLRHPSPLMELFYHNPLIILRHQSDCHEYFL